jgi:Ca2+/Na+ antiporter
MTKKQKIMLLVIFLVGCFALFYGTPKLLSSAYAELGFLCTVMGIAIVFITLLEIEQDRFIKGMWLIALAVLYPIFYPEYLKLWMHPLLVPEDIGKQIELLNQVILLACSGAGGSIIANHADTNTREYRAKISTVSQSIDNTEKIEQLLKHSKDLNRKFNFLILSCVAVILTVAIGTLIVK